MPPLVRSILAIVTGFLVIGALSFGTGAALTAAGVFPDQGAVLVGGKEVVSLAQPIAAGPLLLETAFVAVYAIFGCWLAAFLAPSRPMRHALILGLLGLAFNLAMAVPAWALGLRPAWSILLNLALVMPYAWIGGRLREMQLARTRLAAS
ncbi:MAG: hypothetical protein ACJ8J0_19240 [Longimicrobiaceae bacterium]